MNKFLGNSPSTLSRVFYGTAIIVISTAILPHSTYGRLTYAANCIVSGYSFLILDRIREYFQDLADSHFNKTVTIPVTHIALYRLEITIFCANAIVYAVSFYYGDESYSGWHIIHQISACIYLMYLVKIYIVVIEWRGHNSVSNNAGDKKHRAMNPDVKAAADNVIDEETLAKDIKSLSTNITMYNFAK